MLEYICTHIEFGDFIKRKHMLVGNIHYVNSLTHTHTHILYICTHMCNLVTLSNKNTCWMTTYIMSSFITKIIVFDKYPNHIFYGWHVKYSHVKFWKPYSTSNLLVWTKILMIFCNEFTAEHINEYSNTTTLMLHNYINRCYYQVSMMFIVNMVNCALACNVLFTQCPI